MTYWTYNILFAKKTHFREKKFVDGDFDGRGRIQADVSNKTGESSKKESCGSMKASIQNLIQEFAAVVFDKD